MISIMEHGNSSGGTSPLIEYRNVTVVRNDRTVLDNLSFSITAGENVAILGPNGAGKSSLIKTITRECYPVSKNSESYLRILGKERWDVFELRSLLGIVSAEVMETPFRRFTCREIILSGFFSSGGIWPHHHVTPHMEKKAREVMELLEITRLSERHSHEISAGESRLVLIGRALVHNPPTLLLDEPTSSLDARATRELRQILRKIAKQGTQLIMVTHNLADILPEIPRIILIKNGRVFKDGRKEDMLTSEMLSSLFSIPLEVVRRNGYYHLL